MGGNFAKTPLIALLYAAFLSFAGGFIPYSEGYRQALNALSASGSLRDLLLIIAYCLWICIVAALAFSSIPKRGSAVLFPMIPTFLGIQWVVPLLQQLMLGEVTGVMTGLDTVFYLGQGIVATLVSLLLCAMLFSVPTVGPQPQEMQKYKLRPLKLSIMLLVLPVFYFILYFVAGYFLGWTNDAARAYYNGGENNGFFAMLIEMLIHHLQYGGIALLRGLLLAALPIPLMTLLSDKRPVFIVINTMLGLSVGIFYLLPIPVMDFSIRVTHLISYGIIHLVYGAVSGLLLHTCHAELALKVAQADKRPEPQRGRAVARR